ncbi:MAG: glycerol-3-phosphate dehydrogenase/oxidase [Candidatus Binataceae bacterium]
MTPSENPLDRARSIARLGAEEFDRAIIGGGINGAAIARDAAMRGLRVALVDRGDFAGGTSSRSSKLIHGGFRYLPQGQLKLVYQALRERERLRRRTAPHLVKPIRFLFPIYRGRGFGRFTMSMGLWLYDLFARMPRAQWHSNLNAARVRELEPALARANLTGGSLYYDAWADDARITFENILDAAIHGAAVANYASVEGFARNAGGRLDAMSVKDLANDAAFNLRARILINATGPWVDHIRRLDDPAVRNCVRLTKGVHLIFPRTTLPVHDSLVLADETGRIVFVMPHENYVLVGTTDTDYSADPASVTADKSDVAYLLGVLAESLPGIKLSAEDVASSFAGLRALVENGADSIAPSSVPREEVILESASGMLTVAGGKLTTHREIAEKLVARVMKDLGRPPGVCPTRDTPLPGARADAGDRAGVEALATLPRIAREILVARYGTRAAIPAQIAANSAALALPLAPGCPVIGAEVIHAVRNEMVSRLADFMVRRTAMVWRYPHEADAAAPAVARLMAAELGWSTAREADELAAYRADMTRRRSPA